MNTENRPIAAIAAALIAAGIALTGCAPQAPASPQKPAERTPTMTMPAEPVALPYDTSGWEIHTDVLDPIYDRVRVDVNDIEIDKRGVAVYRDMAGRRHHQPVSVAQYALASILTWEETGQQKWLDRAAANAHELINKRVERDGAWWFQYDYEKRYLKRSLKGPWWSGMAQGEALTVFSLLAQIQPDVREWRTAADRTVDSFYQRGSGNDAPWSTLIVGRQLWFEEYAGAQKPLLVLNGHVFGIFGLYEYYKLTHDEQVRWYLDGAMTTVLQIMPDIRHPGGVSYYCVQPGYCHSKQWQNKAYHPIHIQQLRALGRISGDPAFDQWANLLAADYQHKP